MQVVPVVDSDLWDRANAKLTSNNSWSGDREGAYVYLLSRKIRCEAHLSTGEPCGRMYTGGNANGYTYYKCNGNGVQGQRTRGERCGARMIRADRIEQDIWADLVWQVQHPRTRWPRRSKRSATAPSAASSRSRGVSSCADGARTWRSPVVTCGPWASRSATVRGSRGGPRRQREGDRRRRRAVATVEASLEVSQGLEKQFTQAVPLLGQLRAEIDDITASGDRKTMRTLLDELVSEVRVLDGQTKEPKWEVHWRFRPDSTSNVREFTNIQSVVIMGEDPSHHQRRLA